MCDDVIQYCMYFLHLNSLLLSSLIDYYFIFFTVRVYKGASHDHVITNVAGGKTLCVQKSEFPETGQ